MELRQIIIKELPPPAILVNIKLYLIFLLSTTIIFLQWLSMDYICCLSEEWQWCRNYLGKKNLSSVFVLIVVPKNSK